MTNAPTNSRPEDIAQVAAALDQAMRDAQAIQDQGSFGTPLVAPDPPSWPTLLAPIPRGQ